MFSVFMAYFWTVWRHIIASALTPDRGEWQQIFLHCHPVLRQVLEQLPHPLPGANSLVRRFPTEIWTNINLGRRDVYNFGWGHKYEWWKGMTWKAESLSKTGGDQFSRTNTFQLGPVSACDVICKFIVKIMTRNYIVSTS